MAQIKNPITNYYGVKQTMLAGNTMNVDPISNGSRIAELPGLLAIRAGNDNRGYSK